MLLDPLYRFHVWPARFTPEATGTALPCASYEYEIGFAPPYCASQIIISNSFDPLAEEEVKRSYATSAVMESVLYFHVQCEGMVLIDCSFCARPISAFTFAKDLTELALLCGQKMANTRVINQYYITHPPDQDQDVCQLIPPLL